MERAIDVNSSATVASAVALGTLGTLSFIVQPALVQGYVTHLALGEPASVALAGIEMLGVALATIVLALPGVVTDWRRALGVGLTLAVLGDLASAVLAGAPPFWLARLVAGVGHGTLISLSFVFVGLTARVERNLSLYLVSLLTYGAFGIWAMPGLLDAIGIRGVFAAFAVAVAGGFVTLRFVPRSAQARAAPSPTARQLGRGALATALAGVLAYNVAQGMAWSMLFLIGIDAGIAEGRVADALFISQVFAIGGALAGVVLAERVRRGTAVAVGILAGAGCIALLLGRPSFALFLVAICGFNVLWNFVLPFVLAAVGDFDVHGRMIAPAIAMQMTGLSIGPLLAARLMGGGSFHAAEAMCVAFFLASYTLLHLPMRRHRALLES